MAETLAQLLVCAGIDPSGGAGLIADVRVAALHGIRPIGVATATTVQSTAGVAAMHPLPADVIREQLELVLADIEVAAVKLGMLGTLDNAEAIASSLALTAAPAVWDPVAMGSRGGIALIDGGPGLAARLVDVLGPHVAVVTPNRAELAWLVDDTVASADTVSAARALARRAGCAVLAKGGHSGGVRAVDVLVCNDLVHELDGDRIAGGEDVHGTGCALATAIACELARGLALVDACRAAKRFVVARIAAPVVPGRGSAAVL